MQKGDKVTVHLHGHGDECAADCHCGGVHRVAAVVVEVLKDGFIKAALCDEEHPLAFANNKKRVLTCSPEMYEES